MALKKKDRKKGCRFVNIPCEMNAGHAVNGSCIFTRWLMGTFLCAGRKAEWEVKGALQMCVGPRQTWKHSPAFTPSPARWHQRNLPRERFFSRRPSQEKVTPSSWASLWFSFSLRRTALALWRRGGQKRGSVWDLGPRGPLDGSRWMSAPERWPGSLSAGYKGKGMLLVCVWPPDPLSNGGLGSSENQHIYLRRSEGRGRSSCQNKVIVPLTASSAAEGQLWQAHNVAASAGPSKGPSSADMLGTFPSPKLPRNATVVPLAQFAAFSSWFIIQACQLMWELCWWASYCQTSKGGKKLSFCWMCSAKVNPKVEGLVWSKKCVWCIQGRL